MVFGLKLKITIYFLESCQLSFWPTSIAKLVFDGNALNYYFDQSLGYIRSLRYATYL